MTAITPCSIKENMVYLVPAFKSFYLKALKEGTIRSSAPSNRARGILIHNMYFWRVFMILGIHLGGKHV